MASFAQWALRSPARLALVLVVGAAVGIGSLLLLGGPGVQAIRGGTAEAVPAAAPSTAKPAPTPPGPARVPVAAAPVAERFVRTWLRAGAADPKAWLDDISRVATPQLARALATTDASRVPAGNFVPPLRPLAVGEHGAEAEATLSTRTTIVVQVVRTGRKWRVSDVRPGER